MGKRKSSKPPPKKVAPKVDMPSTDAVYKYVNGVFARLDYVG